MSIETTKKFQQKLTVWKGEITGLCKVFPQDVYYSQKFSTLLQISQRCNGSFNGLQTFLALVCSAGVSRDQTPGLGQHTISTFSGSCLPFLFIGGIFFFSKQGKKHSFQCWQNFINSFSRDSEKWGNIKTTQQWLKTKQAVEGEQC